MTRYLLDTNIVSDVMRNPDGPAEQALRNNADAEIGISLIVKGEVLFGLVRNANTKGGKRFDALLEAIEVWPNAGRSSRHLWPGSRGNGRSGAKMGPNDMWIAAHSLMLDAILVTNDRRFNSVPGLKIENWLQDAPAVRNDSDD